MKQSSGDYVSVYEKNPFSVVLNVDNLKKGAYLIKGNVSDELWHKACKQMELTPFGHCACECVVEKASGVLKVSGKVKAKLRQTCVRTLEDFDVDLNFDFDEEVLLSANAVQEEGDVQEALHGNLLEMGDYLTQQIILHLDPYPVHPGTLSAKEGEFNLNDGQEERIRKEKEEKNPFSVLKGLKS